MKDLTGKQGSPTGGADRSSSWDDASMTGKPSADPHATDRIALGDHTSQGATPLDGDGSDETQVINRAEATPPPATPGRSRGLIAAFVAGSVLLVLAIVYLVDLVSTSGQIERNTTIAGVDVGGLTPEQAAAALNEQVVPTFLAPVTVDVHGEPTSIDPAAAGLSFSVDQSVQAAGTRSANPFARLTSFFGSTTVPMATAVDAPLVPAAMAEIAADTDVQPVEGAVAIDGATVTSVTPVIGRALQVPEAAAALVSAWESGGPAELDGLVLPVTSAPVRATPEATQTATAEATAILSAPLRVTGGGAVIEIPVTDIAAATSITPDTADGFLVSVDAPALRGPFTEAITATEAAPVNAGIRIVDGASVLSPSTQGRTIDWAATDAAIAPALLSPTHEAAIVYVLADPDVTTEELTALGIKEVIGEFTTGGFAAASGENIRVVAEKVNGTIVQPGATFGLNEFTGTRGTEQGYVEAAIIQEGALSTAVGGGISQFATTLYNAAYFAGMGDVTHTPHSFYISRYPAGREATVFDGEIELAFSNDSPTGVLIETIWTEDEITVRLWGTKHVEVESVTSDRFDYSSPQVVVKPYGTSCSPSGGSQGFSVVDTRIIRDLTGAEVRREDFTTVYNGQQNVVCQPAPTPAPVQTPAADPAAGGAEPVPVDPAPGG